MDYTEYGREIRAGPIKKLAEGTSDVSNNHQHDNKTSLDSLTVKDGQLYINNILMCVPLLQEDW